MAEGSIEAFDVGILCGLAWLDVMEPDLIPFAPVDQFDGDQFWSVVDPDLVGQLAAVLELFEDSDDSFGRQ